MRYRLPFSLALVGVAVSALPAAGAAPQAWRVARSPNGMPVAQVGAMAMSCNQATPVLVVMLPMMPARPILTVSVGSESAAMPLRRNGATNVWGGPISDPRLLDLLAGDAGTARVTVDGRGMTVALPGGRQALQTAMAGCYRTGGAPMATPQPAPFIAASSNGGLQAGIYVPSGMKCTDLGYTSTFPRPGPEDNEIPTVIEAGHRFDRKTAPKSRITSAASYVDGTTRFARCPDEQVPAAARIWPRSQYKPVAGLPIKPGYYRIYNDGKPTPQPGEVACGPSGYFRFGPRQYSWVAVEEIYTPSGRPTGKTKNVPKTATFAQFRQMGPQIFDSESENYTDAQGPWLVKAPDRFVKFGVECPDAEFRPVDPRTIPPALMPR